MPKYQFQFQFQLLTLTLCLAVGSAACATSLSETYSRRDKVYALTAANDFAAVNDFQSSFRVIRVMIEEADVAGDAASAQIGYRFLKERQLIANEALRGVTAMSVVSSICENGFDKGISLMTEILNSKLAATAQDSVIAEKTALLTLAKERFSVLKDDACQKEKMPAAAESLIAAVKSVIVEAEREEQRLIQVTQAAETAERVKLAPGVLRSMDSGSLCITYGDFLHGYLTRPDLVEVKNSETLIRAELTRRNLSIDKKLVIEKKIRIGTSVCNVYASWGRPQDVNRTVGSWGVHEQWVYGSTGTRNYLYIQNGRVSSFQN